MDGKSLGRKKVKGCKAVFKPKYHPGELKAAAYDSAGKQMSDGTLHSATGEIGIAVRPEKETVKSGEIVYVDVSMMGENGVVESNAD